MEKRIERLERAIGSEDDWIDVVMWAANGGGIFGHEHIRYSKSRNENQFIPCTEEEELEIMREHYEDDGHKFNRRDNEISFPDYLECYSYLCPSELEPKLREAITRLRAGESSGATTPG